MQFGEIDTDTAGSIVAGEAWVIGSWLWSAGLSLGEPLQLEARCVGAGGGRGRVSQVGLCTPCRRACACALRNRAGRVGMLNMSECHRAIKSVE